MNALYWLILIIVLVVLEIITLGLTTIWFAGGALVLLMVLAFGGVISDGAAELYGMGVTAMQAINRSGLSAAAAAPRAGADLRRAAADACRMMLL